MVFSAIKFISTVLLLSQLAAAQSIPMQFTTVEVEAAWVTKKPKPIQATFALHPQARGWNSPIEAAIAFYRAHNEAYLSTSRDDELAGFLMISETGQFYFTGAVAMPAAFKLQARVDRPEGWQVADFLHTHPGGHKHQDKFSKADRLAVKKGNRNYYLRGPNGDVRFMDDLLAKSTYTLNGGANGESVCPQTSPCLDQHPRYNKPLKGYWNAANS